MTTVGGSDWLYALLSHPRADGQNVAVLYDLTSTYFESAAADNENDKRRYGYSRDKRADCVQAVSALIVTPEGFPMAYEVLPGNTADKTTLKMFLHNIETQYGKGAARLGHGPGHSHRGSAGANAPEQCALGRVP